jgi:hypothetical protein
VKKSWLGRIVQPFDMFVVAGIEFDYFGGKQHFILPSGSVCSPFDSHQKLGESSDAKIKIPQNLR